MVKWVSHVLLVGFLVEIILLGNDLMLHLKRSQKFDGYNTRSFATIMRKLYLFTFKHLLLLMSPVDGFSTCEHCLSVLRWDRLCHHFSPLELMKIPFHLMARSSEIN